MSRTRKRKLTGSKSMDSSCRNHGSCPYCEKGRKHKRKRQAPAKDRDKLRDTVS